MKLDKFDQFVWQKLEEGKSALDFIRQAYPESNITSQFTAEKRKTAIRMHLQHKVNLLDDVHYEKQRLSFNAESGERVIDKSFEMTVDEFQNQTPALVMKKLGLDPIQWKLIDYKLEVGSWTTTIKRLDGTPESVPNYTCRCTAKVRPLQNKVSIDFLDKVFTNIEVPKFEQYSYTKGNKLFKLPIVDYHLGNAPLDVSVDLYKRIFLYILSRLEQYQIKIDKIQYPLGNDFFHIDSITKTTTSGTPVEAYAPWDEIYVTGVDLLIWTMEQLRHIAPVEVPYIKGNHDEMLSFTAAVGLSRLNIPDVTVDIVNFPRKYTRYGVTGIGDSHGREDKGTIQTIMQEEFPEWSETEYREFHLADIHHEEVMEKGGIKFRRLPTITYLDGWHNSKGYTAKRCAQAFIYDKDLGLEDIINVNVKATWEKLTS